MSIEAVTEAQFERLLPMIAAYQGFYGENDPCTDRNREFFRRFIAPSDDGELIAAWRDGELPSLPTSRETPMMRELLNPEGVIGARDVIDQPRRSRRPRNGASRRREQ